ncbi:MAG TPA: AraC family transcriptional regulator [Stellaceae bacterium]|jgi:AraC-like DNA-binding protein|nr:AraC family transcriptional regulator [Stellaceae bacterium]
MTRRLSAAGNQRLEGLCDPRALRARIRIAPGCDGIERVEARFSGPAFSPHRHDTYAIGVTLAGVQSFRYRGEQRHCRPGQCHILHPDEVHDGAAGTAEGFAYRIVYIDPSLIRDALGGGPLPFVAQPVLDLTPAQRARLSPAFDLATPVDDLRRADIATALADLLASASSRGTTAAARLALPALLRVRALIAAQPARRHSLNELERAAGLDRWTLARQFRTAFGTSPTRFRTLRQLDDVRRLLQHGAPLAAAALAAGFADQTHMSRQFKRAYGLTPARWAAAAR